VVCLSVTIVIPAKTVEAIDMPLAAWTRLGPMKHRQGPNLQWKGAILGEGAASDSCLMLDYMCAL